MNILIDIGHPAHVHYFRNFIKMMEDKGHTFFICARDKEVTHSLLNHYKINYTTRGKGRNGLIGKLFYNIEADIKLLQFAKKFHPDILLSFSSPYAAQVSALLGIPHLSLNDTEHTDSKHRIFTYPFSKVIITPATYQNDLGPKQLRLNCVVESLYLHPDIFKPSITIYDLLNISDATEYAIIRFVSWGAFHDFKQKGFSLDQKREIINLLSRRYRIFISSEKEIEPEFKQYQISIPPDRMHDALAYASLFVGESGTMASESALLGVPVVYVNSLPLMCYLKLERENGIIEHFDSGDGVLPYVKDLMEIPNLKKSIEAKRTAMINHFINPTKFLVWFVENYPDSFEILKMNPEYQNNFK